jgi:hypothetical protein
MGLRLLAWTHAGGRLRDVHLYTEPDAQPHLRAIRLISEVRSGAESLSLDRHAD